MSQAGGQRRRAVIDTMHAAAAGVGSKASQIGADQRPETFDVDQEGVVALG